MRRKASVLMFSLVSMGIVTILTQQLMKSVSVGMMFGRMTIRREQATMLAYSGFTLAMAQIDACYTAEKKGEKTAGEEPAQPQKTDQHAQKPFSWTTFITTLMPKLNRLQTFALTEKIDHIDAQLDLCISVEEGKIPVSLFFDEPSRDATPLMKELFKQFTPYKSMPAGSLTTKLAAFFKKRTDRVDDISRLLPFAHEVHLPFWYEPAVAPKSKKEKPAPAAWAVADAFTSHVSGARINPLLFSHALCVLLGLRPPVADDATTHKDQFKKLAEMYDKIKASTGDELWKNLSLIYETKPKLTTELQALFSLDVEPRFYSVLCCATVAGVTSKVLAVIERITPPAAAGSPQEQTQKKKAKPQPLCMIRRLYWL